MHTVLQTFLYDAITGTIPFPKLVTYLYVEVDSKKYFKLKALNRWLIVLISGYATKRYVHKRPFHLSVRLKKIYKNVITLDI